MVYASEHTKWQHSLHEEKENKDEAGSRKSLPFRGGFFSQQRAQKRANVVGTKERGIAVNRGSAQSRYYMIDKL
jgi:hypothetical protein